MTTKQEMGRKSRAAGMRFELRVRKDLESKGWIVDKWSNNIDFKHQVGTLCPAKRKFNPFMKVLGIGTGFPDFIIFNKQSNLHTIDGEKLFKLRAVECKMNGKLDKLEKEKCKWLLENNIFSKILIASKGEKRGQIDYEEFK